MTHSHDQICPWCQTEIVWDPEIGPETTCPHCLNELGDYRSINLTAKLSGEQSPFEDDEADDDQDDSDEDFDDEEYNDGLDEIALLAEEDYEEGVQKLLDFQEEAPECSTCHGFMMHVGTCAAPAGFVPLTHPKMDAPLLAAAYKTETYVCPSCFKVEQVLSENDRLAMVEALRNHGKA